MINKRATKRWLSCLKGQLRSKEGHLVDCLIRDFSSAGARIEVADGASLPDNVELFFPLKKAMLQARVRWRGEGEIGLTFEAPEAALPTDPVQAKLVERLLRLEAENADLRLQTAQLRSQLEHAANADVRFG
jgi:hypothetical protein